MKISVGFREINREFAPDFGEIQTASDDGFEKGYATGYSEGEQKGYADGLAARTYETWEITLTDGTVIEKEVALL